MPVYSVPYNGGPVEAKIFANRGEVVLPEAWLVEPGGAQPTHELPASFTIRGVRLEGAWDTITPISREEFVQALAQFPPRSVTSAANWHCVIDLSNGCPAGWASAAIYMELAYVRDMHEAA